MIGQATAYTLTGARGWLARRWGTPYLHKRQDWRVLAPSLLRLPQGPVRVLDAGCGPGAWSLELAALRPRWTVLGLDREMAELRTAEAARRRLQLGNVAFVCGDFLDFRVTAPFDVVLSVCSAHYLAHQGKADALFRSYASWLRPGGTLLMLVPRRRAEVPFAAVLPARPWWDVFGETELHSLLAGAGFAETVVEGVMGEAATLAKQLDWALPSRGRLLAQVAGAYPACLLLDAVDRRRPIGPGRRSLMWRVEARRAS